MNPGVIAGPVVAVVVLGVLSAGLWWLWKRKKVCLVAHDAFRMTFVASRANGTPSFSYCLGKGHGSLGVVRKATIDHAFSKTVA